MANSIDFKALNQAALTHCPGLLEKLLPEGKQQGNEFVCGNLAGDAGKSCKINLHTGKWSDFKTHEAGGDLISLVAAIENTNQIQAARLLAEMIGYSLPATAKKQKEKPTPIIPVPAKVAAIPPDFKHYRLGYPTATYAYHNTEGRLLGYTCRFNKQELKQNGKLDKEFAPLLYTNHGWKWQGFPIPYPFYGLERLADLPTAGLVIGVEGEGKADKLQKIIGEGIAVIAINGGSSKTANMDYRPLEGKRVLYWPDNDEPGFKAALEFARKAQPIVESLKIIKPPKDAKETWDCADAIDEGWDKCKITDWIESNRIDPEEFAKLANLEHDSNDKKPKIIYRPGELPRLVKEIDASIKGKAWRLNDLLVSISRLPEVRTYRGLKQAKGTSVISPFDVASLSLLTSKSADWVKIRSSGNGDIEVQINPPKEVIQVFLAAKDDWTLPPLTGLVTCPIIRLDGSILDKPGYDAITGLYADFDASFCPIVTNPDKQAALEALGILKSAIDEFPFKTGVDQAVALAAMLTAVLRPSVKSAPLFAFSAPTPGTGKSALADLIGTIATGKPCAAMDFNRDEAEFKKALIATLLEGSPVTLIDNIVGELNNSLLNMILSQETISGRILGLSKNAKLATTSLWLATGNNLEICGDLTRRTLLCTLDAETEKPAERTFKRDIYQWGADHRSELAQAALTILSAYHMADKPLPDGIKPMNGFNDWSRWVRGALLWLGEADPKESQLEIEAHDPEREGLRSVLQAWHEHWRSEFVTTKDLLNREAPDGGDVPDTQITLYQALLEAIPHGRELTGRLLGKWLARHNGRVISGLKLINTGQTRQRMAYWQVVKI